MPVIKSHNNCCGAVHLEGWSNIGTDAETVATRALSALHAEHRAYNNGRLIEVIMNQRQVETNQLAIDMLARLGFVLMESWGNPVHGGNRLFRWSRAGTRFNLDNLPFKWEGLVAGKPESYGVMDFPCDGDILVPIPKTIAELRANPLTYHEWISSVTKPVKKSIFGIPQPTVRRVDWSKDLCMMDGTPVFKEDNFLPQLNGDAIVYYKKTEEDDKKVGICFGLVKGFAKGCRVGQKQRVAYDTYGRPKGVPGWQWVRNVEDWKEYDKDNLEWIEAHQLPTPSDEPITAERLVPTPIRPS